MNKVKFKELRSEFRKCSSDAYYESSCGESFGKAREARLAKIQDSEFDLNLFESCEKPAVRDLIVSMPIFRALDYPFKKFEALL